MQLGANIFKVKSKRANVRKWLRLIPGLFMIAVLAAGGVAALLSPGTYELPEAPLFDGSWAEAYEEAFNEGLIFREAAVTAISALDYSLFRVGLEGVLIGEEDWLYTTEEFLYYPDGAEEIANKLRLIKNVRELLEVRDIELIVALVPAKARVYEEHLGRLRLPEHSRARYEAFRARLLAEGIAAPDLAAPLQEAKDAGEVFLRTDTHWTPLGARAAAQVLRDAAEGLGLELDRGEFTLRPAGEARYFGDLLNFLPLGNLQERLGPAPDIVARYELEEIESDLESALFGDLSLPVVLVGTSYSAGEAWRFDEALQEALGLSVLNVALEGQGPMIPMLRYLQDPAFAESPPEMIIWEMPERYLPVRYDLEPYGREGSPFASEIFR
jgi:alginate O-acetyltransferase complex protein AlgJ